MTVPENPTAGLTPILGDHEVVVTGEEHHQPALQPYAPRRDGRPRRVAVELVAAPIARGTHAGEPGVEVQLDGRRVGELTARMSQRYGPLVVDVLRRGGRPSCIALVRNGGRGLEVVLNLPNLRSGEAARPAPAASAAPDPSAPTRRRPPILIGAGIITLLVVVGVSLGGRGTGGPETEALSGPTAPTATSTTTAVATTTVAPPPPAATQPPAPPESQPQPEPQPQPRPRPASRPVPPPPPPAPQPAPEARTADCNPNYTGCVPNARDVNCPEVDGPVDVIGRDVYRLDSDDDGVACE